jgi:hypothetical protein
MIDVKLIASLVVGFPIPWSCICARKLIVVFFFSKLFWSFRYWTVGVVGFVSVPLPTSAWVSFPT